MKFSGMFYSIVAAVLMSNTASATENRAIKIQVFGVQMAPKAEDYQAVRAVIGGLVADLAIEKYVVNGWGIEGGFDVCIQQSAFTKLEDILAKLKAIRVDASVTHFSAEPTLNCN